VNEGGVAAFGEELKRQREARGLALESVCQATKVPLRHIRALEAGSYDELPGGVFRRGFVRSYVGVLGLEETDWMKRFEESCRASGVRDPSGADWTAFAENVKSGRGPTRRSAGVRGVLLALLVMTVALAGWCGWRLKTHKPVMPTHLAWLSPRPVKAAPR
jgi:cytoskeletal protein RodZ